MKGIVLFLLSFRSVDREIVIIAKRSEFLTTKDSDEDVVLAAYIEGRRNDFWAAGA